MQLGFTRGFRNTKSVYRGLAIAEIPIATTLCTTYFSLIERNVRYTIYVLHQASPGLVTNQFVLRGYHRAMMAQCMVAVWGQL